MGVEVRVEVGSGGESGGEGGGESGSEGRGRGARAEGLSANGHQPHSCDGGRRTIDAGGGPGTRGFGRCVHAAVWAWVLRGSERSGGGMERE